MTDEIISTKEETVIKEPAPEPTPEPTTTTTTETTTETTPADDAE